MTDGIPVPSTDRTHHKIGLHPAYSFRFDNVLDFHPPGLASVQRDGSAWHIRTDGSDAYRRRFLRTFGFYEGAAAVISKNGWHHISPNGSDCYQKRYAWCGNFQNSLCTVRDEKDQYFHINSTGTPAYPQRWRYAGDFNSGIGVVQDEAGSSTHILSDGSMLHNRWFSDLDIFHKGYARARDEDGWMHVDTAGVPAYAKRYSAIEPFYNGQARVERFDGGLEVIRENGDIVAELRGSQRSHFSELSREMVGFWQTHTIATAVCLGVFEQLPAGTELIAERCGLETKKTERLLKALGELRLVVCQNNEWHVTAKGEYLLVSTPMTLVDAAVEYSGPFLDLWGKLPEALRSNSGWRAADIFETVSIAEDRLAPHHRMLRSYAMHDYNAIPKVLALNGDERVLDAGGGTGALGQFLLDTYPGLSVTIFDRPDVVNHATNLAKSNLDWRSGDLFSSWGVEADVIILARVLHDWPDGDALKILHQARETLSNGGKLFIIEMLLPDNGFVGALCDLHLLVVTGGQERTESEYSSLLEIAGFTLMEVRRTETLPCILVAVAADST